MLFKTEKLIIRPLQHDDLPDFHDRKGNSERLDSVLL